MRTVIAGVGLLSLCACFTEAATLNVVNVAAPQVWCLFSADCAVTTTDTTSLFAISGVSGQAQLTSRTFQSEFGSAAGGNYVYMYRLSLSEMTPGRPPVCVISLLISNPQPALSMDLNGDGQMGDHVFAVTNGLGNHAPKAEALGDNILFRFEPALCPTETSFYFGFVSGQAPVGTMVQVTDSSGNVIGSIAARTPDKALENVSLTLTPGHGIAGSGFMATGQADPRASGIRLFWDDGQEVSGLAQAPIGSDGSFEVPLVAPKNAKLGTVQVQAFAAGLPISTRGGRQTNYDE